MDTPKDLLSIVVDQDAVNDQAATTQHTKCCGTTFVMCTTNNKNRNSAGTVNKIISAVEF